MPGSELSALQSGRQVTLHVVLSAVEETLNSQSATSSTSASVHADACSLSAPTSMLV